MFPKSQVMTNEYVFLNKILLFGLQIIYACFITATALLGLIIECQRDFKNQYSQENVIELSFNESDTEDISSVTSTEIPHVENNNSEYNDLARFLEIQMSGITPIIFWYFTLRVMSSIELWKICRLAGMCMLIIYN